MKSVVNRGTAIDRRENEFRKKQAINEETVRKLRRILEFTGKLLL